MNTDTAHAHWNQRRSSAEGRADWLAPDPQVAALAETLHRGAAVLDLGCGVGRHSLALARMGFRVSALDASSEGVAELVQGAAGEGLEIAAAVSRMTELPYADAGFDYVLAFNVIYHGDRKVVARTVGEVARVLRPGGLFQFTLLSTRNRKCGIGREVSPGTWIDDDAPPGSDKRHPHHYCDGAGALAFLDGFDLWELRDAEQATPGSFHWHIIAERRA